MNQVVLSLGSNVGDREYFLTQAISKLKEFITDFSASKIYATHAVGMEKGHDFEFKNMVCLGSTTLTPSEVLHHILEIEKSLGRVRGETENYLSRTIDIDILFYNNDIIETAELIVPHPRLTERTFVLLPLSDLLPNFIIPGTKISVQEALSKLENA